MEGFVSLRARQTPSRGIRTRSSVHDDISSTRTVINLDLSNHQVSNTMSDNTATVTVTLSRDWLRDNHLHLQHADNRRLALVSRQEDYRLTKPLELFTQWREHSYELLFYEVVDTDEAENNTELLQTVILELQNKIKRMIREDFAGEQAPLEDVSVSQGLVQNAVNRARDRLQRHEDTAAVRDLMQRLNLWNQA